MKNKDYQIARARAEQAEELWTFEKYNGWYTSRYMDSNDIKDLRKDLRKEKNSFTLDGFNNRAVVIKTEDGWILRSYYTEVAEMYQGKFIRLWDGYSNTTLKHINAFRNYLGLPGLSKREWIEMEVN